MLLTIDIGNTNIVLGLFAGDRGGDCKDAAVLHDWRMRTDARMTADEMALTIRGLLGDYSDKSTGIELQIDFLGNGTWVKYDRINLIGGDYKFVGFPDGFSAHWVRLVSSGACKMTAAFQFT